MAFPLATYYIKELPLIERLKDEIIKGIGLNNSRSYSTNVYGQMTSYMYFLKQGRDFFNQATKMLPKIKYVDAWGNLYLKGDFCKTHFHGDEDVNISGIIYLDDTLPGTYFNRKNIEIKPEPGKIILFSSREHHEVRYMEEDKERYTISFNGVKE